MPGHEGARFDALFGLGLAYLEAGMPREALGVSDKMNADNRAPAMTGIVRARAFIRLGMAEAGLAEGEFAVWRGAENPYLLLDMAFEYARAGDEANALRLLDGVRTDEAPGTLDNYELRFGRTSVLLALKHHDRGMGELEDLMRDFGEDENLLNALGVQHLLRGYKGDKLRAKRYFDRAMRYSRDDLTLSNRALILAEAGAVKEALEMTREALKVARTAPRSPLSVWSVSANVARYAAELGDVAGAKKLLNELIGDEDAPEWVVLRARRQLEEIERGDVGRSSGGLPPVPGDLHARLAERNRRLTVELFERKVCDECKKELGWHSCEAGYDFPELKEIGDLDVYGIAAEEGGAEAVYVGECKLRFEKEEAVSHGEMSQLVDKKLRPLREHMDRIGDRRPLRGFFFANAGYDEEALRLARNAGVRVFEVRMSREWQNRDDWWLSVKELDEQ
jgi:tetratricopeptide (TPR) repeat protein